MISVVGALDYAIATGRDLIIDWRRSRYLADGKENLFAHLFEISPVIEGCRITISDGRLKDKDLPQPILRSEDWSFPDYHQAMISQHDRPEPTIIVRRAMHHLPAIERQRELLRHIRPVERIRQRIEEFRGKHMAAGQIGGVHVRHGNGERLSQKRDLLIAGGLLAPDGILSEALERWAPITRGLLVCSDSAAVHEELAARHAHPIWLHTERLLFNPSWFSHYARVMGNFVEEPINVDTASDYGTNALYDRLFQEQARGN